MDTCCLLLILDISCLAPFVDFLPVMLRRLLLLCLCFLRPALSQSLLSFPAVELDANNRCLNEATLQPCRLAAQSVQCPQCGAFSVSQLCFPLTIFPRRPPSIDKWCLRVSVEAATECAVAAASTSIAQLPKLFQWSSTRRFYRTTREESVLNFV